MAITSKFCVYDVIAQAASEFFGTIEEARSEWLNHPEKYSNSVRFLECAVGDDGDYYIVGGM